MDDRTHPDALSGMATAPRQVAMISMHTSPLEQPGTGDAGGLNVYVVEVARRLAAAGTLVDVFTRATDPSIPLVTELSPGVLVRQVTAGPVEGVVKEDLPGLVGAFTEAIAAIGDELRPRTFDLVHTHYWLAGQAGVVLASRWGVPLVHTMHTMARVKNEHLASDDTAEPEVRERGEEVVVAAADRLVANTRQEGEDLTRHYGADPALISVVNPGVDLAVFQPGSPQERPALRRSLGLPPEATVLLFVGRIQPLKRPDLLLRGMAQLLTWRPDWRGRLLAVVLGGASGARSGGTAGLRELAEELGIADLVRFVPPVVQGQLSDWYRAVDLLVMPSHSESFGLVAAEAQASGTPVLAADVGGLRTVIMDGASGVLVADHEPATWARVILRLIDDPELLSHMGKNAAGHADQFSWEHTVSGLLDAYGHALGRHRRVMSTGSRPA